MKSNDSADRSALIIDFLKQAGWGKALREPLARDASTRRYERLQLGDKKAILMDAPKGAEAPSEPEGASEDDRCALGYNAMARLAGPNAESFAAIASELTMRGFSAPRIMATDLDNGLMLLEDLGFDLYTRALERRPDIEQPLYEAAIDTLAALYRSSFPKNMTYRNAEGQRHSWRIRDYDALAMMTEADLMLDWYIPDTGSRVSHAGRDEWRQIWRETLSNLKAHAPGLALRDFHADNLFWLPERQATDRVGLIDFQDALFAPPAYDLVSLIEDARRDVAPSLHEPLIKRFCSKAGLEYDEAFRAAYAAMGAQRNAKILGIFVRLSERDGKPHYRKFIPRVARHFLRDISHPALAPLKAWCQQYVPALFDYAAPIKTAMVLAAGEGRRMLPITEDRSKAMVMVGGQPLIDHTLDRLAEVGVERAVVNVHAHADQLEAHLRSRTGLPEIIISDERDQRLETGGGVVKALDMLGDGPIYICNIDSVWTEERSAFKMLLEAWDPDKMDDLLLLARLDKSLGYNGAGDFDLLDDGRLVRRRGERADYAYMGVFIARLEPLKNYKPEPFSFNKIWDAALEKGRVYGAVLDGFWMHVGDPKALEDTEARFAMDTPEARQGGA